MTNKILAFWTLGITVLIGLTTGCSPKNNAMKKDGDHEFTNQLINESSPYLLQHAHNPVNWHPWGEEALQKAKDENKLLIISIGYAACHWCHVMEHESFEDSLVASIMNEHFVPIKVDREERPDVDDIYMTACQLISGSGGWPLNAFALPDGSPVWAGTYFPKDDWLNVLNQFVKLKESNYEKLEETAGQLTKGIRSQDEIVKTSEAQDFNQAQLEKFSSNILKVSDKRFGGRTGSPKFPMPSLYEYLLKQFRVTEDPELLRNVNLSLTNMAEGGIYDQLGGGFARYSTDEMWLVPHFEKMLYDNAQLVSLYSKAYQATKIPLYEDVVRNTLTYIEREMTDEEGGFYSSLDADTEGEEGKFYVWESDELAEVVGEEAFPIVKEYYGVTDNGNWENTNVLHRPVALGNVAAEFKLEKQEVLEIIADANELMMKARDKRVRPPLDDKQITAWNALMVTGYVDAFKAFGEESYRSRAIKATDFLLSNQMNEDGQLFRNYKDGASSINAFLDDYAFMILALIDVYEISFDEKYLEAASEIAKHALEHFYENETGMFYFTSDLDPPLVARKTELNDNVIPGSNSAMGRALFELGTLSYDPELTNKSVQMLSNMNEYMVENERSDFLASWISLYNEAVNTPYEIAIVGPEAAEKRDEMVKRFVPDALFLGGETEGSLKLLEGKLQGDETFIYVCQNKVCKFPVRDVEAAIDLMTR